MYQVGMGADRSGPFVRHRGPVTCAAGIPNSSGVLTSGYDGAVARFDLETGGVTLLGYHDHLVNQIAVSPSGTKAATASSDFTCAIWDLKTGKMEMVLYGHSDDADDFRFVDDQTGVSVSHDHQVILWDLSTGRIRKILLGHEKCVLSVVSHAGRLYTSGDDMTLRVWDLQTGEMLSMWGPFEVETDSCAIDPVRGRAVLGCDDGYIRVFDAETQAVTAEIPAHASGIKRVAISPKSGDILSSAYDQKIHVWDPNDFCRKVTLDSRPMIWERSFNWLPDGTKIVAGTFDGTVVAWDAASGRFLRELGQRDEGNPCFNQVSANEHGEFAAVSDDGILRMGVLRPDKAIWTERITPKSGRVLTNAVTLDDRHNLVVTGAHNQTVHIFERRGARLDNELEVQLDEGPINTVRVAHHAGYDRNIFVACYSGTIVRLGREGQLLGKIRAHHNAVKALRLHPERALGVSCSAEGTVHSWNFEGEILQRYIGHMSITDDVDFDPFGRMFCSVSRDFTAKIFELDSGRLLHSVGIGKRSPKAVLFWDSRTVLVTNYWGWLIRIDLASGEQTRRHIAENGISSISRAGEYAIAVSYDGGAYLVRPDDLAVVQCLRTMTQRLTESSHVRLSKREVRAEPSLIA